MRLDPYSIPALPGGFHSDTEYSNQTAVASEVVAPQSSSSTDGDSNSTTISIGVLASREDHIRVAECSDLADMDHDEVVPDCPRPINQHSNSSLSNTESTLR